MADIHDQTFKKLMEHKPFFVDFFEHYLPIEIFSQIDWDSAKVFKISGEHFRATDPSLNKIFNLIKDIGDLAYLVEKKNSKARALVYLHVEHQSTPDPLIALRTNLYVLGTLYEYAQMTEEEKLPDVYSIIYYHGRVPYVHATNIWDMFNSDYDARRYLFDSQFVDLHQVSDQQLLGYNTTGAAEFAFKHIFAKRFDDCFESFVHALARADKQVLTGVLRYVFSIGRVVDRGAFVNNLKRVLRDREGVMSTIAEYLEQKGYEKGVQQGMQQGMQQSMQKVAADLYKEGADLELIKKVTGLSEQDLLRFRNS